LRRPAAGFIFGAGQKAMKPADQLIPSDFATHRVWEFANDLESQTGDETVVRPVAQSPVDTLANRLVGTVLTLANGQNVFGILGNIDLSDPVSTEHFLTVAVFRPSGERFDLARYHDVDYACRDAAATAAFLNLPVAAVFPIRYDITDVAVGQLDCLRRTIPAAPPSRLSRQDLMDLAITIGCRLLTGPSLDASCKQIESSQHRR
jgi:hypothetical protein